MRESYSDFSIVQNYIELKSKYETEVKNFSESTKTNEAKYRKQIAVLEQEVAKRNEYIKAQEEKIQELTRKISEKDEQLKTMGLQLHKLKLAQGSPQQENGSDKDPKKKSGFFK